MKIANILALCALMIFILSITGIIPGGMWYAGLFLVIVAGAIKFWK